MRAHVAKQVHALSHVLTSARDSSPDAVSAELELVVPGGVLLQRRLSRESHTYITVIHPEGEIRMRNHISIILARSVAVSLIVLATSREFSQASQEVTPITFENAVGAAVRGSLV